MIQHAESGKSVPPEKKSSREGCGGWPDCAIRARMRKAASPSSGRTMDGREVCSNGVGFPLSHIFPSPLRLLLALTVFTQCTPAEAGSPPSSLRDGQGVGHQLQTIHLQLPCQCIQAYPVGQHFQEWFLVTHRV